MKKRILSIVLVSVMLLSTIPGLAVSANPAVSTVMDYKNYRSVVTSDTILVDGELDEIYKNSQKITGVNWIAGSSSNVNFEAYTAVTLRGIYVWAEIKDGSLDKAESTPASSADRFQIYIRQDDGIDLSWGWYESDYNGNVNKHPIMTAADIEGSYENYWSCVYSTKELCDPEVSTLKLADGSGWRSEIFIPFSVELVNFTNYNLTIGFQAQNGNSGSADYGICFDRAEIVDAWYRYDCYKPIALVSYIDRSPSYAPNYVFNMRDILTMDDVPLQGELINNAAYVQGQSFSLDGQKDALYSEHAKVPMIVWHTYYNSNAQPVTTPIAKSGDVYVAFDDTNLYVYYEKTNRHGSSSATDDDNLEICYIFNDGSTTTGGRYVIYFDSGEGWSTTLTGDKATGITHKVTSLGSDRYGVECKIPLPSGVKEQLSAKNASFDMNLGFNSGETVDGSKYYLSGSTRDSSGYYDYSISEGKYPTMRLSKTFTDETPGAIHSANLTLGADITVNYYATIGSADVNNAYIRFTRNEKEYIAYPRTTDTLGQYKFSFAGIAPQNIGDNIKAELVVDGKVIDTYEEYSVRQNLINTLAKQEYASNVKMNNLIKALLNYGAAAQKYVNYDTNNLVDKYYGIVLSEPTDLDNVRSTGTPISNDFKMTAAGVYFYNVNKIYIKFKAPSLVGVTVTMNGVPASIQAIEGEANMYIAYSDSIPVTQFGVPYEIILSDGTNSQTAIYSVNSYAYAKRNSTNKAMAELAKATYTYGDAAKKYAGVGDTIYTVLTYNDADNNSPYDNNYGDVMQIINDCNPDLVGMQEVQQSHVTSYYLATNLKNEGDGCYSGTIGNYAGVFYWSTPCEPNRADYPDTDEGQALYKRKLDAYNGEVGKPSGDMILYRKDKFEIVKDNNGVEVKGRFWLSETPDVPSILPTTEYTQCVMYLLLRDKQTGNEILYINLHASYLEANKRQIEILMELFEAGGAKNSYVQHAGLDMTSYRKIYTADWNCGRYSSGYNVMNANGYLATEEMLSNVYKPATTVNGGSAIDFCFAKPSEFKTLKYKVINDHPLSLYTSDHYPVYSKIAWAEEYEDVLFEEQQDGFPSIPENPSFDEGDNFFYTDDDTDGFVRED